MIEKLDIKMWLGIPLFWIGNWLFVRPAQYLWEMPRTTTGGLISALSRSDLIDKYGIEGCAMMKSFADTYLDDKSEDT